MDSSAQALVYSTLLYLSATVKSIYFRFIPSCYPGLLPLSNAVSSGARKPIQTQGGHGDAVSSPSSRLGFAADFTCPALLSSLRSAREGKMKK